MRPQELRDVGVAVGDGVPQRRDAVVVLLAHFKAELFRDWGFAAARARAEALMEALPGSTFGKKTQVRESLSRKDQENMIARSNRAFQTGTGPDPYPSPAPPRAAEGVSGWRS